MFVNFMLVVSFVNAKSKVYSAICVVGIILLTWLAVVHGKWATAIIWDIYNIK